MAITINGNGTITGYTPVADGSITAAKLASVAISAATLPAGSVLQVVNTNATATQNIATNSNGTFYGITDLDTTITTLSANSKLLISCQVFGEATDIDAVFGFAWQRGISGTFTDFMKGDDDGASRREMTTIMSLGHYSSNQTDTPSATSLPPLIDSPSQAAGTAITYRIGVGKQSGSVEAFRMNQAYADSNSASYERGASWMTVMEIKT